MQKPLIWVALGLNDVSNLKKRHEFVKIFVRSPFGEIVSVVLLSYK